MTTSVLSLAAELRRYRPAACKSWWLIGGLIRDAALAAQDQPLRGSPLLSSSPSSPREPDASPLGARRGQLDVDIAVVGDVLHIAHELAATFGGEVQTFERFLSAKVVLKDPFLGVGGKELDIVHLRRERYAQPGALPDVEAVFSLGEDLPRRDFSINTLAIDVDDDEGRILDLIGGKADLQHRQLRALHARSFFDDPTRLLRGARYAGRYGLHWEEVTTSWVTDAITAGVFASLSPQRLWRELSFIAEEPEPRRVLAEIDRLQLWRALPLWRDVASLADRLIPEEERGWGQILLVTLWQLTPPAERASFWQRVSLSRDQRRLLKD